MAHANHYAVGSTRSHPGTLRMAITLVAIAASYLALAWDTYFTSAAW